MTAPSERPFGQRYLMLMEIPFSVDAAGDVWLDRLWHRDLAAHLSYLPRFTLVAPRRAHRGEPGLVRVAPEVAAAVRWVDAGPIDTWGRLLRGLPGLVRTLWREIGRNDVVHGGAAGWPIPLPWIGHPIARLRGRGTIVVVESATWRRARNRPRRLRSRLREWFHESVTRRLVTRADLALLTQPQYRDSLFRGGKGRAEVVPATWIDEADLLDPQEAAARWRRKCRERPVRVLFAGRLVPDKGVDVLLRAMARLEQEGCAIHLEIIGAGPLREACERAARGGTSARVHVSEPLDYGPEFLAFVGHHHALVVPSLLDEQARILFDARAQAVPVIATDTAGSRPHVAEDETGWLVPPADAEALARALSRAATDVDALRRMGLAGRQSAEGMTHAAMHARRLALLHEVFG